MNLGSLRTDYFDTFFWVIFPLRSIPITIGLFCVCATGPWITTLRPISVPVSDADVHKFPQSQSPPTSPAAAAAPATAATAATKTTTYAAAATVVHAGPVYVHGPQPPTLGTELSSNEQFKLLGQQFCATKHGAVITTVQDTFTTAGTSQ